MALKQSKCQTKRTIMIILYTTRTTNLQEIKCSGSVHAKTKAHLIARKENAPSKSLHRSNTTSGRLKSLATIASCQAMVTCAIKMTTLQGAVRKGKWKNVPGNRADSLWGCFTTLTKKTHMKTDLRRMTSCCRGMRAWNKK